MATNIRNKRQREEKPTFGDILVEARKIWRRDNPFLARARGEEDRQFREFFGCCAEVALSLWSMLVTTNELPDGGRIEHMLWTLMFMKIYGKQAQMCLLCGNINKETLHKWVESFVEAIANLQSRVIIWCNRFKGDRGADCLCTVDCVDCRCPNWGPAFSSHKFAKKGGLRYEVAICIQTGDIVWVNGPYPCGRWPDIKIFRDSLMTELELGERMEADDGYIGEAPQFIKCPKSFTNPQECLLMQSRCRSRQETGNKRFKDWEALKQIFRHDITLHGDVFRSVVIVTQLSINNGERLFECGYKDPPFNNNDGDTSSSDSEF